MTKVLSEHVEWLGKQVVEIAFQIHKTLGPGLLEKVYEACFSYELTKRNLPFVIQKKVPIIYDNIIFEEGLRLDLLVDDLIIIEIKAQENYHPVWEAQLTNKRLGFLINFQVPLMKDGIKRIIL